MRHVLALELALTMWTCGGCSSDSPATAGPDAGADPTCGAAGPLVAAAPSAARALPQARWQLSADGRAGSCLAVASDDTVVANDCSATAASQFWDITPLDDGSVKVEVGSTGNAMDASGGGSATGTPIVTWPFSDGAKNRRYRPRDAASGTVELENVNAPAMCVALGTKLNAELQPCGASAATRWNARKVLPRCGMASGLAAGTCVASPRLPVTVLPDRSLAKLGRSFDANTADLVGPHDWATNYGTPPELIPLADGDKLDVMYRDQDSPLRAYLVHLEPSGDGWAVTRAYRVQLLGALMGFARADDGTYFYATGVDEAKLITVDFPPNNVHRPDIVRLVGFDASGCVRLETDVDIARGWRRNASEMVINPMTFGTSHLAWGGGLLALLHSTNTQPDMNGTRHQKALTTHVDTATGQVVRTDSMWVSHSFDQRIYWDGSAFVELHLGDAFPRAVALGRFSASAGNGGYPLFSMKGDTGANSTYTRLGGIAPIEVGDFHHLVVFATDRDTLVPSDGSTIDGNRDLALVRVVRRFDALDPAKDTVVDTAAGSVQTPTVAGQPVTNHLTWLTDYQQQGPDVSADRPRLLALGNDQYLVFWERWNGATFEGTWRLGLDGSGQVKVSPMLLGMDHIPRFADPLLISDQGALVVGHGNTLGITLLDPQTLAVRTVTVH